MKSDEFGFVLETKTEIILFWLCILELLIIL